MNAELRRQSLDAYRIELNSVWKAPSNKMNWSSLEAFIRGVLFAAHTKLINHRDALILINEGVAAYTRRGMEVDYPEGMEAPNDVFPE